MTYTRMFYSPLTTIARKYEEKCGAYISSPPQERRIVEQENYPTVPFVYTSEPPVLHDRSAL